MGLPSSAPDAWRAAAKAGTPIAVLIGVIIAFDTLGVAHGWMKATGILACAFGIWMAITFALATMTHKWRWFTASLVVVALGVGSIAISIVTAPRKPGPVTGTVTAESLDPLPRYALQDRMEIIPKLSSVDGCNTIRSLAIESGGIPESPASFAMNLQGQESKSVVLANIQAKVVKRAEPALDAYVSCPTQGNLGAGTISFDLSSSSATLVDPTIATGDDGKPLFAGGNEISLEQYENFPIAVQANAVNEHVSYILELSLFVDGKPKTVDIYNHGKPFEVSDPGDNAYKEYIWWDSIYHIKPELVDDRRVALNPDDCSSDLALAALKGVDPGAVAVRQLYCRGSDMTAVEYQSSGDPSGSSPSCIHYAIGRHVGETWTWSLTKQRCLRDPGAVFNYDEVTKAGLDPEAYEGVFGWGIVSASKNYAASGRTLTVVPTAMSVAETMKCDAYAKLNGLMSKSGIAVDSLGCIKDGYVYGIFTFTDVANREAFRTSVISANLSSQIGGSFLKVIGPNFLVYGQVTKSMPTYKVQDLVGGDAYCDIVIWSCQKDMTNSDR